MDDKGEITALTAGSTSVIVTAHNGKSVSCKLTVTKEKEAFTIETLYADNIIGRVGLGNYEDGAYWSKADNTYTILWKDQICIFNHIATSTNQSMQLYFYNHKFNYLSQKTVKLPYTEWGGFFQGEDGYYYVAVGQKNTEEDNKKTVFSILKLDTDFKEVGRCNITGGECSTITPYAVGFARMTMDGTTLIVHTDRERYTTKDGLNHQSNLTFMINTTTMKQAYVSVLFPYNIVSHSMNQFVKMDGGNLINKPSTNSLKFLEIDGTAEANYTGTKVNGFEIGANHNIVAGVSIPHDTNTDELEIQNVFISITSKDGKEADRL